eukprot:gene1577-12702_t
MENEKKENNEKLEFEDFSKLVKEYQSLSASDLEKKVQEIEKYANQLQWEVRLHFN